MNLIMQNIEHMLSLIINEAFYVVKNYFLFLIYCWQHIYNCAGRGFLIHF